MILGINSFLWEKQMHGTMLQNEKKKKKWNNNIINGLREGPSHNKRLSLGAYSNAKYFSIKHMKRKFSHKIDAKI